jgi:hypothetical protein
MRAGGLWERIIALLVAGTAPMGRMIMIEMA